MAGASSAILFLTKRDFKMSEICRFRKKLNSGRHTFYYNKKRLSVVPGQIVVCTDEALGKNIGTYDRLGIISEIKESEKIVGNKLQLVALDGGYYNVINPDNPDKPLNSKALRKSAANKLLSQLSVSEIEIDPSLEDLKWDDLLEIVGKEGIPLPATCETAEELKEVITKARKK